MAWKYLKPDPGPKGTNTLTGQIVTWGIIQLDGWHPQVDKIHTRPGEEPPGVPGKVENPP